MVGSPLVELSLRRFIADHPYVRKAGGRGITENEKEVKKVSWVSGKRPEGEPAPEL
jgi:hypothetical protein